MTQPNNALSLVVKGVLEPYLGDYMLNGSAKAKAYWPVERSMALEAEGLNATWKPTGLEAIFSLYPGDEDGPRTFTTLSGTQHYQLVLKAWSGSTRPALDALTQAYPVLSTRIAKRPRLSPSVNGAIEMLTLWIPVL